MASTSRDPAVPGRRQDLLRHAALAAGLGRGVRRAVGARSKAQRAGSAHARIGELGGDAAVAGRRTATAPTSRRSWSTSAPDDGGGLRAARTCAASSCSSSSQPDAVARARRRALRRRRASSAMRRTAHRLVGRGRQPRALGPSRQLSRRKPTFAFMVSLEPGARAAGAPRARARPSGSRQRATPASTPASYDIVTATHPRRRSRARGEEIVFSCHLDHPRPGANDNASGCATILEVARTLAKLIREGKLPRARAHDALRLAARGRRHAALLNARPEIAARFKAAIHLDMVGGGPETKAVFHVTRGPASLPSFVHDVAERCRLRQRADVAYASGAAATYPLVAPRAARSRCSPSSPSSPWAAITRCTDRQLVPHPGDLSQRLARPLHPHRPRRAGEHRPDQAPARRFHRRRHRLVPGQSCAADTGAVARCPGPEAPGAHGADAGRGPRCPATRRRYCSAFTGPMNASWSILLGRFARADVRRSATQLRGRSSRLARLYGDGGVAPDSGARRPSSTRAMKPKGPMSVFGYDYLVDHLGQEQSRRTRIAAVLDRSACRGRVLCAGGTQFCRRSSVRCKRFVMPWPREFGLVPLEPVVAISGGAGDDWRAAPAVAA